VAVAIIAPRYRKPFFVFCKLSIARPFVEAAHKQLQMRVFIFYLVFYNTNAMFELGNLVWKFLSYVFCFSMINCYLVLSCLAECVLRLTPGISQCCVSTTPSIVMVIII